MRRLLLFVLVLTLTSSLHAQSKKPVQRAVTVDTHADTPSEFLEKPFHLGKTNDFGHFDYPRMKAGDLDAEFFVAYVPKRYAGKGAASFTLKIMETIHEMVEDHPQWARFAESTKDIRDIAKTGKRAILIGIEGGHAIEDSLEILRGFYRLGARYMTLTHSNNNNWADSSGENPRHNGLTDFGRQVVLEMNRLGMLVDISHVSDDTFYDAVDTSKAPVFASHSSVRVLAEHKRNMSDDMIRALARSGGVIMINFNPPFLATEIAQASAAREEKLKPTVNELKRRYPDEGREYNEEITRLYKENPIPRIPYTRIVDHIDHVVKIAGVEYVGLGSDFDGISSIPEGMEDVSKLPSIREELKRRGYTDANIRKIMGENFMRVFAEAEKVSRQIRAKAE